MKQPEIERKLSYDTRRKELNIQTREKTEIVDMTTNQTFNEEGIRSVNAELQKAKDAKTKMIVKIKETIKNLEDQQKKLKEEVPEQTPEEKKLIEQLTNLKKYERFEQVKNELESQNKNLEDQKESLKELNKNFEEFKSVVKLKL